MNPREYLLDKIAVPVTVALLTSVALSIRSQIKLGDWLAWIHALSPGIWLLAASVLTIWIVVILVRQRLRSIRDEGPFVAAAAVSAFGYLVVGKLDYADVIWRVVAPNPGPLSRVNEISAASVEVETRPRCPKCETELGETGRFFGGYWWSCVACGWMKKSAVSHYRASIWAERIARREIEKETEERSV